MGGGGYDRRHVAWVRLGCGDTGSEGDAGKGGRGDWVGRGVVIWQDLAIGDYNHRSWVLADWMLNVGYTNLHIPPYQRPAVVTWVESEIVRYGFGIWCNS